MYLSRIMRELALLKLRSLEKKVMLRTLDYFVPYWTCWTCGNLLYCHNYMEYEKFFFKKSSYIPVNEGNEFP